MKPKKARKAKTHRALWWESIGSDARRFLLRDFREQQLKIAAMIGRFRELDGRFSEVDDMRLAASLMRVSRAWHKCGGGHPPDYNALTAEFAWRCDMAVLGVNYK